MLLFAGRHEAALQHARQGLRRELLPPPLLARALVTLASIHWRSLRRGDEALALLDEAQALEAGIEEPDLRASALALRGFITGTHLGDAAAGERLHEQALELWQTLGDRHAVLSGLYNLAVCAENAGRTAWALERLNPLIAEARALQDWRRLSQSLNVRANALCDLRRYAEAFSDYQDCLRTAWRQMASYDLAFGLWNLPRTLARLRRPEPALALAAFAARYWRDRFGELSAGDHRYLERIRRLCARQVPLVRIGALWQEGERLTVAQAVELALQPLPPP